MINRLLISSFVLATSALPAFAQSQCTPGTAQCGSLPEPMTMTLFGLGIGGAYVARKLIRRK